MSIAATIQNCAHNAMDATARAVCEHPQIDQDWDRETTFYQFDDGSILAVSGAQVNSYADFEALQRANHT